MPKVLFDGDLSLEATTLYSLMLDRVGLSAKNGWTDSLGRVRELEIGRDPDWEFDILETFKI